MAHFSRVEGRHPFGAYAEEEEHEEFRGFKHCASNRAAEDETSEGKPVGGIMEEVEEQSEEMEVWDEEDVLNLRLREAQRTTEEARKDRTTMLKRLGLVNSRSFRGKSCNVAVSREYSIDGWDSERSLMRVNREHTLSLDPDVVGVFMGIDFKGPTPDHRAPHSKFDELEEYILDDRKKRPFRTGPLRGLCPDSLEPRLRNYIRRRRPMLGFTNSDRQLPQTQVYAFKEELYFNKRFNWVASRIQRVEAALARSMRRAKLSNCLKGFLAEYIHAALKYQQAGGDPGEANNSVDEVRMRAREGDQGNYQACRKSQQQRSGDGVDDPLADPRLETWKEEMKAPKREYPVEELVRVEVQEGHALAAKIQKVNHRLELGNRLRELEGEFIMEKAKNSVIASRVSNLEEQREMEIVNRNRAGMMVASLQADQRVREESARQTTWRVKILESFKTIKSFLR